MMHPENSSLNTIDTETKLFSLLVEDASTTQLNLQDRYNALQVAIIKTEKRIASMLDQGLDSNSPAYRSLVTQQVQLQAFLATISDFHTCRIDDELLEVERQADLADNRKKLERHFKARPAKIHTAPSTPSLFKGLSKAERIRLMQQ